MRRDRGEISLSLSLDHRIPRTESERTNFFVPVENSGESFSQFSELFEKPFPNPFTFVPPREIPLGGCLSVENKPRTFTPSRVLDFISSVPAGSANNFQRRLGFASGFFPLYPFNRSFARSLGEDRGRSRKRCGIGFAFCARGVARCSFRAKFFERDSSKRKKCLNLLGVVSLSFSLSISSTISLCLWLAKCMLSRISVDVDVVG